MSHPILAVEHLTKRFDVSEPWLVRTLTGEPRRVLTAVNDVSFAIPQGARSASSANPVAASRP